MAADSIWGVISERLHSAINVNIKSIKPGFVAACLYKVRESPDLRIAFDKSILLPILVTEFRNVPFFFKILNARRLKEMEVTSSEIKPIFSINRLSDACANCSGTIIIERVPF